MVGVVRSPTADGTFGEFTNPEYRSPRADSPDDIPGTHTRTGDRMSGFDAASYGDAFADVYDEWYAEVSDVDATVATLRMLGGDGPFLELGVGTGRLALALAATGARVVGVDASQSMLDRLRAKVEPDPGSGSGARVGSGSIEWLHGDMISDLPEGPFPVVFIAYNTFFSLGSQDFQQRLFAEVERRLTPQGVFVVETAVPDVERPAGGTVGVRSLAPDRVVLSVDVHDPARQTVEGQFVEITEGSGVRLRPWRIRYCSIDDIDAMAGQVGLYAARRWESMSRDAFSSDSPNHVSVFARVGRTQST